MLSDEFITISGCPKYSGVGAILYTATKAAKGASKRTKAPLEDFEMISFDGAYSAQNGTGGWGCIARAAA